MKSRDLFNIPDVQSDPDSRKLAIDKVGIKAIRHPVRIMERSGGAQHTIATFNMYVGLPHHFKGTHMSRFVEILEAHEREITVETFQRMLREMVDKLEAEEGVIEMAFPYFIEKKAPVSGVKSLMDYEVSFTGVIRKKKQSFTMKVLVPVTSLCPCSKKISERGVHGARHGGKAGLALGLGIHRLDLGDHAASLRGEILGVGGGAHAQQRGD